MEMSTPGSPKYQQWMTFQEVGDLTSNPEGAAAIRSWLTASGVSVSWESAHKDYLKATAPISVWETMLNTKFSYWTDTSLVGHKQQNKLWVRAKEYSIPEELEQHVHTLFNTVHPPPVVSEAYHRSKDNKKVKTTLRMRDMMYEQAVTPAFLNSYYGIPSNIGSAALNQSVFETADEYYSPSDLNIFQNYYQTTVQKAVDIGGFTTSSCSLDDTGNDCFEGNLDIQYIMGISQVTSTIYWYVGGNDPFVDYVTDISDMANPSQSNSISWGTVEQQNSLTVLNAFNTETLKLTAQGVTVMVSTGDNGVANFGCVCNSDKGTSSNNCACGANSGSSQSYWAGTNSWSGTGYFPSFPATCPYVTAVGATMFPASSTRPEIACQSQLAGVITSGGGFSTYYAQPSWQTAAVTSYFAGLKTQPASGYNAKGRGIPDISLLGVNYQVVVADQLVTLFGTSASSPVFAGMISLVNAARHAKGLPNVGFINPTLYTYGLDGALKTFTDVDSGNNRCCSNGDPGVTPTLCCAAGFNSTAGWDPVTGWGSVTFANLTSMLNGGFLPSAQPTHAPSVHTNPPVSAPSVTIVPSAVPVIQPVLVPSAAPSVQSSQPVAQPVLPSAVPVAAPVVTPITFSPSNVVTPTALPTTPTNAPFTCLPTKIPSLQPTPVLGFPTLAPSVNNVVSVSVTQVILGSTLTASSFNSNPNNAFTVQEAATKSVANVQSVVIGAVWNYAGSSSVGRRVLQTVSGVNVNYTVAVNNGGMTSQASYTSVTNQITSAVETGAFTTYMNDFATTNGATVLTTATSDEVSVAASYSAPTSAPVKSPSSAFGGMDLIITLVVLLVFFAALSACCLFYNCRYGSRSAAAAAQPPPQEVAAAISSHSENPLKDDMTGSATG
eukprot:gene26655-33268_t